MIQWNRTSTPGLLDVFQIESCSRLCNLQPPVPRSPPQGDIATAVFGILLGAVSLGQTAPGLVAIGKAREAGYTVFATLERRPEIDSASSDGKKPNVTGCLELNQVR